VVSSLDREKLTWTWRHFELKVPDQWLHLPAAHSALPVTRALLARITQHSCYLSHIGMLLSRGCIRGVSAPFELYTAVHTIAQYEACNSLIYKDKQVRLKWPSDCDRDGIPSCCWDNRRTGEEPR
jgi:hypothetical protein